MKAVAIGIAFMFLITVLGRKPITVKGVPSIIFMLFIAWGLGHIFLTLLGAVQ